MPPAPLTTRQTAVAAVSSIVLPIVLATLLEDVLGPFFDTPWIGRIGSLLGLVLVAGLLAVGGFLYRRLAGPLRRQAWRPIGVAWTLALFLSLALGAVGLAAFFLLSLAIVGGWGVGYGVAEIVARLSARPDSPPPA